MSENVLVALIGAVPVTLGVIVDWQGQRRAAADPERQPPGRGTRLKRLALFATLAAAAAGIALAVISPKPDPHETVVVSGRSGWTDTTIDLESGDVVSFAANGIVYHSEHDTAKAGPDGVDKLFPSSYLPDKNHAALLGKLGTRGEPFVIGSRRTYVAPAPGRLFLGVNDTDPSDNSGQFTVEVDVDET